MFQDFLGKMECKKHCLSSNFNNLLVMKNHTGQTGEDLICDLHSPDTFNTRLGEQASANVQPCCTQR